MPDQYIAGQGRKDRQNSKYLLIILALVYASSFIDRAIIYVLAESIKRDLNLTDTQLGILSGIAFAALYSILGIPVARIAESKNRLSIITIALTVWSVMTVLCGAAGNFWQLAAARAGVGVGEAACTPCAHSMISDSYPPDRRATALSVYSLGAPVGTLLGILGGAWVAEAYSWQVAFFVVGAPGALLALVVALTLKEPQRGRFDPPGNDKPPALLAVLRFLFSRPVFRHLLTGLTISTVISAGLGAFAVPYLLRSDFNLDLSDVAVISALVGGIAACLGTLMGGPLSDALSKRSPKLMLWVPAISYLIAAPFMAAAYGTDSLVLFMILYFIGQITALIYFAPSFGVVHNMVEPRMRATTAAVVLLFAALVGLGVGPVLVGAISDGAAYWVYGVDPATCGKIASQACSDGTFGGLTIAMIATSLLYLFPAYHYFRAGSYLGRGTS